MEGVATGDHSPFADLALTPEEASLLVAAADDEAEVVGHGMGLGGSLNLGWQRR